MEERPFTHAYGDDDEAEDNRHEHGIYPTHGMAPGQMAAMFAKQAGALSGKKLGKGTPMGNSRFQSRASSSVLTPSKPVKQAKSPISGKTPSSQLKAPKTKDFQAKAVKTPKATAGHTPKAGAHPKKAGHKPGKHAEHEGGHSPLNVLQKIGKTAASSLKEAGQATLAASGQENTAQALHKSTKGHKFGDPDDGDGRHADH